MSRLVPLTLLLALLAAPAWAAGPTPEDTTPGGSATSGFPIALAVLVVVAVVVALVWRAVSKKKTDA